jgi:Holliday junction resolvase RusA-like endonuclease
MIYDITPCPKPRMTRQDKFRGKPGRKPTRPCVARYWAFKDEVKLKMMLQRTSLTDYWMHLNGKTIIFHMPMPKSWSKKKRDSYRGHAHLQTPDKDNLEKALMDALYLNDSGVWDTRTVKLWDDEGAIEILNTGEWLR